MASAAFTALCERAHHSPAFIVRVTFQNSVGGGTTQFLFGESMTERIALRLGVDALPLIVKAGGVGTSIEPGKVATSRGVKQIAFRDMPNWSESFGAGALASSGGSFFQRLQVAFPGWHRSKVEGLLGFDDPTLSSLSDWEPLWTMQLEDWTYEGDNVVTWTLADIYELKKAEVPTPVGDDQLLVGAIVAGDRYIKPSRLDFWLEPQSELPSQDWLPPVMVLRPGTVNEERVAIARWSYDVGAEVSGKLVVCQNWLDASETFQIGAGKWVALGGLFTVTPAATAGPWGPENGTHLETAAADELRQDTTKTCGSSEYCNFSFWFREDPTDPGRVFTLVIADALGDFVAQNFTAKPYWQRASMGVGGSGAASTFRVGIRFAGVAKLYVAQAQFVWEPTSLGASKQFYVPGTGHTNGGTAGRAQFGTTAISHPDAAAITERAYYRRMTTDADSVAEGLHPVWIVADILNRAHIPPAWGDPTLLLPRFQEEADYRSGARFRRVLVDPQGIEELLTEVCEQFMLSLWCDKTGYMKCRIDWRPLGPGTSWPTLTRESDLVQRGDRQTGYRVDSNKKSQANWVRIYWGLRVDSDGKEKAGDRPEDFLFGVVEGDFDPAVVGQDFRSLAGKTIFAKWFYQTGDARALAGRILSRFKRGARKVWTTVGFRKFLTLDVADSYRIDHPTLRALQGSAAVAAAPLFQVTRIDYGHHAEDLVCQLLEARQTRIAHITPTSTDYGGSFPNDYDLATPAQRDFYGFVGDTNNKVGASKDDGYVIG